ncbi:hypothetical protein SLS58_004918 [Diplodia intermedia]|uniref:Pectate lyase n=1 Tax=Diplodia intermedia TaxID=856260 RepID=A0ABR3TSQ3_9PEZI
MQLKHLTVAAILAAVSSAQFNIPAANGRKQVLSAPRPISGYVDYKMAEFDRGKPCTSDKDQGSGEAVFVLAPGATLANVIIGADAFEGVHCQGSCTLLNVWFRDVCEDAITLLGSGSYRIAGGGARNAVDKVIQHNGVGNVEIKDFSVSNVGKLYRACGDCSNNAGKKRTVVATGIKAYGCRSDLIGINSNFGDVATVSNSCGSVKNVCQEFRGINKGQGQSTKVMSPIGACKGAQGGLHSLPAC